MNLCFLNLFDSIFLKLKMSHVLVAIGIGASGKVFVGRKYETLKNFKVRHGLQNCGLLLIDRVSGNPIGEVQDENVYLTQLLQQTSKELLQFIKKETVEVKNVCIQVEPDEDDSFEKIPV